MSEAPDDQDGDVKMASVAAEAKPAASFRPFTKAERIQQLNDIDKVRQRLHYDCPDA